MAPSRQANGHGPSEQELRDRNTVKVGKETVFDTTSVDFPGHFPGEDHAFSLDRFRAGFNVDFHQNDAFHSSFSLIGIDASLANAFRRILLAEIPTLAIENVYIENNTSVIQDEVLAHRLGLIPFKGGKEGLHNFLKWHKKPAPGEDDPYANCLDWNTVRLELSITCTVNKEADPRETDPLKAYHNAHVYARDIVFQPTGRQSEFFSGEDAIMPTNPDILIAKLRPRQTINLAMHMHKGLGSDHAKFSPVATASYRLMPTIQLTKPIVGADAEKFQKCFTEGVIGLKKISKKEASQPEYEGHAAGEMQAVVEDPMRDTVSREALRHKEFEGKVKLGRRRDHFVFSVESTGQWDSDELFMESVKHMKAKCKKLEQQVIEMVR